MGNIAMGGENNLATEMVNVFCWNQGSVRDLSNSRRSKTTVYRQEVEVTVSNIWQRLLAFHASWISVQKRRQRMFKHSDDKMR